MKGFVRLLKLLLVLFLLILGSCALYVSLYHNSIAAYLVNEINKSLDVKIRVEDYDVSGIRDFPRVSLSLYRTRMAFPGDKTDEALVIEMGRLALQFNWIDFFDQRFEISRVIVEEGSASWKIEERIDLKRWMNYDNTSSEKGIVFDIHHVELKDILVRSIGKRGVPEMDVVLNKIKFNGLIGNNETSGKLTGALILNNTPFGINIPAKSKVVFNSGVRYQYQDHDLEVIKLKLNYLGAELEVDGHSVFGGEKPVFNVDYSVKNIDIEGFDGYFPDEVKRYKLKGNIDVQGFVRGRSVLPLRPYYQFDYQFHHGSFLWDQERLLFKNINADGTYYGEKRWKNERPVIIIDNLENKVGDVKVKCRGRVVLDKQIGGGNLNVDVHSGLIEMQRWIDRDVLRLEKGDLNIKGKCNFTWKEIKKGKFGDMTHLVLKLNDSRVALPYNGKVLSDVYSEGVILPDVVMISVLKGKAGDHSFNSSFKVNRKITGVSRKEAWMITGDVATSYFAFDEWIAKSKKGGDSWLPLGNVAINCKLKVGQLSYKDLQFTHVMGDVSMKQDEVQIENVCAQAFQGNIALSGGIKSMSGGVEVLGHTDLNKVEIRRVFSDFDSFGQQGIMAKNIRGKVTGDVNFKVPMDAQWNVISNGLIIESNIAIESGAITAWKPLLKLSGFIKDEKLAHVEFDRLQNTITIRDSKIFIPKMMIYSSAMDIELSGVHGFDNKVDYTFGIRLLDLLHKKTLKAGRQGWGMVHMKGDLNDPVFDYELYPAGKHDKVAEEDRTGRNSMDSNREEDGALIMMWDDTLR